MNHPFLSLEAVQSVWLSPLAWHATACAQSCSNRNLRPDPHSRALGILPRTLEIFRGWGIYERFLSAGTLLTKVDFWVAGQTEPVAELNLSVFAQLSATPGILILPQNRTETLLLEATKATGLTKALLGHKVVSFEQDTNGVSVEVAGPDGATQDLPRSISRWLRRRS